MLRLPGGQAPENRVAWAAGDYLKDGNLVLKYLPLDLYCMIPDKIVTVAFGAFVVFYFFPLLMGGQKGCEQRPSARASAAIFLLIYSLPLAVILFLKFINV